MGAIKLPREASSKPILRKRLTETRVKAISLDADADQGPHVPPNVAHADQRDRAARLRDTAGRFTKRHDSASLAPEPTIRPEPQEAAPSGTVPAPADAPDDAYALSVNDDSLGMHADRGAALIVAPEMPTGAGLAVFYLKGKAGPVIYDLTHGFRPESVSALAPDSELMPLIEVAVPGTGQVGGLRAEMVEKIHRVIGVYSPADLLSNHGPRPAKLPVLTECPEGMGEQYVSDAVAYPLVRKGETVIYDPSRREPTSGALCLMQWGNDTRSVMLTNFRRIGGQSVERWWVAPVNRPAGRLLYTSDGPYSEDALREKIVGTVVGVLVPQRVNEPTREPEAEPGPQPAQPDAADEIYADAEKEREAAEAAALNDADLMSAVSSDLRAAIVRHGEVMRETQLRGSETNEEFQHDADLQIDAEYAVAHTPARSLADIRAKLTYLLPIMAPNMLDQTHVGHLSAIRDDADRLCCRVAGSGTTADASDLASACMRQVERLTLWDANPGSLSESEGDAEMARSFVVFQRAITEPSPDPRTMAAKAALMLDDLDRFHPEERRKTDDFRLMRVILREVIAQGRSAGGTAPSPNAKEV